MRIALVSCTKLKQDYACEARHMYQPSHLFSKAVNYIENVICTYDCWFILSAKYGLLKPTDIIEPYDLSLKSMSKKEVMNWSFVVFNQLYQNKISHIDFYAGEKYRTYLMSLLSNINVTIGVPLKGMSIGKQLQFYNNNNNNEVTS